jgi:hypothetical protein
MSPSRLAVLSRILLIAGSLLFVISLFLPTYESYVGFFIWILSIGYALSSYQSIFIFVPALFAFAQIYYAWKPKRSKLHIALKWSFVITSIATPIFLYFNPKIEELQIGYYVWQTGYWLTTAGLFMRREEKEIATSASP